MAGLIGQVLKKLKSLFVDSKEKSKEALNHKCKQERKSPPQKPLRVLIVCGDRDKVQSGTMDVIRSIVEMMKQMSKTKQMFRMTFNNVNVSSNNITGCKFIDRNMLFQGSKKLNAKPVDAALKNNDIVIYEFCPIYDEFNNPKDHAAFIKWMNIATVNGGYVAMPFNEQIHRLLLKNGMTFMKKIVAKFEADLENEYFNSEWAIYLKPKK